MLNLVILGTHILVGTLVLGLFWRALLTRKGSPEHRRAGRRYLKLVLPLLASVVPIVLLAARESGGVRVFQLLYLTLVFITAAWTAWRAVRDRQDPARYRGLVFRTLAFAMAGSGLLLLWLGIAARNVLLVGFSTIGIVYGGAMIGFLGRPARDGWWLEWHLNGVCLLFAATHASFMGLVARTFWPSLAGDTMHAATQLGTIAFAYCLRQWLGARGGRLRVWTPVSAAPPRSA